MVMFDVPPPLQCKGIEAYERTWGLMFRYHKPGAAFDIDEQFAIDDVKELVEVVVLMPVIFTLDDAQSND